MSASNNNRNVIALAATFFALNTASSFVSNNVGLFGSRRTIPASASHFRFHAVVFEGDESYWDNGETFGFRKDEHAVSLKDTLLREGVDSLARVAAAFAPSEHAINLKDIDHVDVLGIDGNHIDIEAVVCQEDTCVTHMVPVPFPHPCPPEEMEGCVLDNVGQLDAQAEVKLKDMEWTEAHEVHMLRSFQDLASMNQGLDFPDWWVPIPSSMSEDCDGILEVLNQKDFTSDVRALAVRALSYLDDGERLEAETAIVIAICPAGIYLRVTARNTGFLHEGQIEIVDVPCAFGGEPAVDSSSLRGALQTAIGSALEYVRKYS